MKKETITQKARAEAVRFYHGIKITGVMQDWIDDQGNHINIEEDIDNDVRDLANLLIKFHKECQREKL